MGSLSGYQLVIHCYNVKAQDDRSAHLSKRVQEVAKDSVTKYPISGSRAPWDSPI